MTTSDSIYVMEVTVRSLSVVILPLISLMINQVTASGNGWLDDRFLRGVEKGSYLLQTNIQLYMEYILSTDLCV